MRSHRCRFSSFACEVAVWAGCFALVEVLACVSLTICCIGRLRRPLSANVRALSVNDADLHQKLFRHYVGELAFFAAVAVLLAYFIWPMFSSAVTAGFITLHAGNVGPKTPVLLAFADYPLAVAGVLLVYFTFFVLVLALLAQPAYHAVQASDAGWVVVWRPAARPGIWGNFGNSSVCRRGCAVSGLRPNLSLQRTASPPAELER